MKALTGLPTQAYIRVGEETNVPVAELLRLVQELETNASPAYLARYRPDVSAGLAGDRIRGIRDRLRGFAELSDRRITILSAITQQDRMTPQLREQIEGALERRELEDLYLPYKSKQRTPADEAAGRGLEGLARFLWEQQPPDADIAAEAAKHVGGEVPDADAALQGAREIVARWLAENIEIRRDLRKICAAESQLTVELVEQPRRLGQKEEMLRRKFEGLAGKPVKTARAPWRQVLSLRRGAREGLIRYRVALPEKLCTRYLLSRLLKQAGSPFSEHLQAAAQRAFEGYLASGLESDVRQELEDRVDREAVAAYRSNLEKILMAPGVGRATVIGLETGRPGGWRAAVVNGAGELVEAAIVRPDPERPKGRGQEREDSSAEPAKEPEPPVEPASEQAAQQQPETGAETAREEQPGTVPAAGEPAAAESPAQVEAGEATAPPAAEETAAAEEPPSQPDAPVTPEQESAEPPTGPAAEAGAPQQGEAATAMSPDASSPEPAEGETPAAGEQAEQTASGHEMEERPAQPDASVPAEQEPAEPPAGQEAHEGGTPQPTEPAAGTGAPREDEQAAAKSPDALSPEPAEGEAAAAGDLQEEAPEEEAAASVAAKPETAGLRRKAERERPVRERIETPEADLAELIAKHDVAFIALGNGPAMRQVERFVRLAVKRSGGQALWAPVNEAGSWIYATSKPARREFPKAEPAVRSAVCLARRLQDPLAEMARLDPRLLGVGQGHHEVDQRKLRGALQETLEECVSAVGADVNTGPAELLALVPGMTERAAKRIVEQREKHGPFSSRAQLAEAAGLNRRIFDQSAGFFRIYGGDNPFDETGLHPRHYDKAAKMLEAAGLKPREALEDPGKLRELDLAEFEDKNHPIPVLEAIVREFEPHVCQPRGRFSAPRQAADVDPIEEPRTGMKVDGVVTNVTGFGVFVDIGAEQDGLAHISHLPPEAVEDDRIVLKAGDKIAVWIIHVDQEGRKISLSTRAPRETSRQRRVSPEARLGSGGRRDGPSRRREPGRERAPVRQSFGPEERKRAEEEKEIQKLSLEEKLSALQNRFRTKV